MKQLRAILSLVLLFALTACDSVIYQDEGDCEVTYKLRFVYDMNMKWADAFANEVKSVRVYVFDENDRLVWTTTESGPALASGNYTMTLPVDPGKYHIIAWCGADNNAGNEDFTIADGKSTINTPQEASCILNRNRDAEGNAYFKADGRNMHSLFHGEEHFTFEDYSEEGGEYTYTMPLTKDTNTLRVVLQHLSGEPVNVEDFDFYVTDSNGFLLSDNSLKADETITYYPFFAYSGEAGIEEKDPATSTRAITMVSLAEAEIAFPRMMVDHKREMYLNIYNKKTQQRLVKVPVIDYALLVKGYERKDLSDQEYLDRQDEYSMVFFLNADQSWVSAEVIINAWRVVIHDYDLGGEDSTLE